MVFEGADGIPPGGWIMRGILVGRPVADAELEEPAVVMALAVMEVVGANTMLVGTDKEVCVSVPDGTIEYSGVLIVVSAAVTGTEVGIVLGAVLPMGVVDTAVPGW